MKRIGKAGLLVLPVSNVLLAATNGWHRLVWTGFEAGPPGSNLLIYQHGAGFYLVMAVAYGYIATAVFLLARALRHASLIQRRQIRILLAGMTTPLLASLVFILDLPFLTGVDVIPISFLVTGVVLVVGIQIHKLFDLVPVARERLIEGMTDGLLVWMQTPPAEFHPTARKYSG